MKLNFTKRRMQNCYIALVKQYLKKPHSFTGYFLHGSQIVTSSFEEGSLDELPLFIEMVESLEVFLANNEYHEKTPTTVVFNDFLNSLEKNEESTISILHWIWCEEGYDFYGDFESCFKRLNRKLFSEYDYFIFQGKTENLKLPSVKQKNEEKEVKTIKGTRLQAEKAMAIKVGNETRQNVGIEINGSSITFDFENQEGLNRFIETYFQKKGEREKTYLIIEI